MIQYTMQMFNVHSNNLQVASLFYPLYLLVHCLCFIYRVKQQSQRVQVSRQIILKRVNKKFLLDLGDMQYFHTITKYSSDYIFYI